MSVEQSERGAESCPSVSNNLHIKSFKLRFASQRELGRSYVSAIKPLGLPAVVRAKECAAGVEAGSALGEAEERALRTVAQLFGRGPRDKYPAPLTSAHEYGWWSPPAARRPPDTTSPTRPGSRSVCACSPQTTDSSDDRFICELKSRPEREFRRLKLTIRQTRTQ